MKYVNKLLEKKKVIPERSLIFALQKAIDQKLYKEVLNSVRMLVENAVTTYGYRDLLKFFLGYEQLEYGFELLKLIPLDVKIELILLKVYIDHWRFLYLGGLC